MCKDCNKLNKLVDEIGLREKFPHLAIFCCNECMFKEIKQHFTMTLKRSVPAQGHGGEAG